MKYFLTLILTISLPLSANNDVFKGIAPIVGVGVATLDVEENVGITFGIEKTFQSNFILGITYSPSIAQETFKKTEQYNIEGELNVASMYTGYQLSSLRILVGASHLEGVVYKHTKMFPHNFKEIQNHTEVAATLGIGYVFTSNILIDFRTILAKDFDEVYLVNLGYQF